MVFQYNLPATKVPAIRLDIWQDSNPFVLVCEQVSSRRQGETVHWRRCHGVGPWYTEVWKSFVPASKLKPVMITIFIPASHWTLCENLPEYRIAEVVAESSDIIGNSHHLTLSVVVSLSVTKKLFVVWANVILSCTISWCYYLIRVC